MGITAALKALSRTMGGGKKETERRLAEVTEVLRRLEVKEWTLDERLRSETNEIKEKKHEKHLKRIRHQQRKGEKLRQEMVAELKREE